VKDDLERLLRCLPPRIRAGVNGLADDLVEIAIDIGRAPVARCVSGFRILDPKPLEREELSYIIGLVGAFKEQRHNRAGIDGTLHRLSLIRDRYGNHMGMTIRVGRHLTGVAEVIRDLLDDDRASLLLIGAPGSGKTTLLRDIARILSERLGPAVIIVDSNNEIGGDGSLPHPAIGMARRMQVPENATQYDVLLESVRNHFPEVVIIDEIGSQKEAEAARTIARRGVRLIATAHGYTLADVANNPELGWLVGGRQEVALAGDAAALPSGRRVALERIEPPAMGAAIEIQVERKTAIYRNVAHAVDAIHAGALVDPDEIREIPIPKERLAPPPPQKVRTHEIIPEDDPWGLVEAPRP
jgi:stage III sporulation protein SpoIIIAA